MTDPSQAELDAHARALGFPDYAIWAAWNRNRTQSLATHNYRVGQGTNDAPPVNHLQNAQPRHHGLFGYILDRWQQAVGK